MKFLYLILFTTLIGSCSYPTSSSSSKDTPFTTTSEDKLSVAPHELPEGIFNNLEDDLIFSSLKLIEANKFKSKSKTYYDLKFQDEEQFTIMATFDELGNLVSL
ncbi:hypothetical protein GCM10028791_44070 [Echinicola sediminis]